MTGMIIPIEIKCNYNIYSRELNVHKTVKIHTYIHKVKHNCHSCMLI